MISILLNSTKTNKTNLGMLTHAPIKGVIQPSIQECSNTFNQQLIVFPPEGYKPLASLKIDTSLIIALLEAIKLTMEQLSLHLLAEDQLQLRMDCVFYQSETKDFQFVYNPNQDNRTMEHLNFYRSLIIDSDLIHEKFGYKLIHLLRCNEFSEEKFYDALKKSYRPVKSIFRKHSTKFSSQKSNSTVQIHSHACLIEKKSPYRVYPIKLNTTLIGTSDICNIKLSPTVEKEEYAKIIKEENAFYIKVEKSCNAVKLNQKIIHGKSLLENGMLVAIKDKEFIFIP